MEKEILFDEHKNLNYYISRLLRKIVVLKIVEEKCMSDLARKLEIDPRHYHFRFMIKLLEECNIAETRSYIGNIKIITINRKKLEKFIREKSHEFREWGKFIETTKPIYNEY